MSTEQSSDSKRLQLTAQQKLSILFSFAKDKVVRANTMRLVYHSLSYRLSGFSFRTTNRLLADDSSRYYYCDHRISFFHGRIEVGANATW